MLYNIYILYAIILLSLSIFGLILSKQNVIVLLISIELMLISINLSFVLTSLYLDDVIGQLMFIILLVLAGSEAAVGLSILILFYRLRGLISIFFLNTLKG